MVMPGRIVFDYGLTLASNLLEEEVLGSTKLRVLTIESKCQEGKNDNQKG